MHSDLTRDLHVINRHAACSPILVGSCLADNTRRRVTLHSSPQKQRDAIESRDDHEVIICEGTRHAYKALFFRDIARPLSN